MGYNIEVSFHVIKSGNLEESVKKYAEECCCDNVYQNYEFENKTQFIRRHCIITTIFSRFNIEMLIKFLKFIKTNHGLYLESIYDDEINMILYASQYYISQKMDKNCAKKFTIERRSRSYSEDESIILKTIKYI